MIVRRSATALAGISAAGLAATVLAIPAHANTDVTVTEDNPPGWSKGDSYPSEVDVSAITASDDSEGSPTPITFAVSGPAGLNDQTVWVRPFASEDTESTPISRHLYQDEALSQDCDDQANCNVTSDGTPVTLYVNPDPVATYVGGGFGPPDDPAAQPVNPFRVGFINRSDGQRRLTFGGAFTGLTVTYGTPPAPDPGDDGGGGDGGDGDGGDQSSGGSGSAGSTSSSPNITLQVLDEADGSWARALEAGLVAWEKTVPVNTWQPLPNSADVVGTGQDEGKVFLGVATTPDFPVSIAQRQVDNGWGAYDMHDDQGNLESVFIPAGGSMFVWTQPRLYAVWGAPSS